MMKLINTIEISPLKYSKEEDELTELPDNPSPEDWYNEWIKSITLLDLNFDAIQKGSFLVDIATIDERNLQIILEINLQDIELKEFEDRIIAFDGGIVLMDDDKILIEPSCCGDIGNIKEWQKIFENTTSDWSEMWIGHPWIFYRKQTGKVQFSAYSDSNLEDFVDIKPIFEIDESELKIEFEKVKQHQINFKYKVSEILKKINVENAEKISELMTGIN